MTTNKKRATARLSKNGRYLIVEVNGQNAIVHSNLIRYLFDIPYTRKDGTHVSNSQIFQMKQSARAAYDAKVQKSEA